MSLPKSVGLDTELVFYHRISLGCLVIGLVQLLEHSHVLVHHVVQQPAVLDCGGIVQGGLDGDSLIVDQSHPYAPPVSSGFPHPLTPF